MQRPEQAARVVEAVAGAVNLPVSVKLRLGWDAENRNVLPLAKRLAQAGAAAIAVHGRTREQFYAGQADWQLIGEAAASLPAPVIGYGDVTSGEQAAARRAEFGCAGIMVGRGLLGNPWLVRDMARHFAGLAPLPSPSRAEIFAVLSRHLRWQAELLGEYMAVRVMRSHLPFYLKGLPGAAALRGRLNSLGELAAVEEVIKEFLLAEA